MLTYAKVLAALAYYYDHQEEIDAEMNEPEDFSNGKVLDELITRRHTN